MGSVFVAGSINMDVVATVTRHPKVGETVAGHAVHFFPGGKGANQAVAAAKLGASTALIGRLGVDPFGQQLRSFLAAQGVDLALVKDTTGADSGTAIITIANADNSIVVVPGANARVSVDDVAAPLLVKGDVAVSQFEIPLPTVGAFFERARAAGATTILNPAPAIGCSPALLDLADILILNETELGFFTHTELHDSDPPDRFVEAAAAEIAGAISGFTVVVTKSTVPVGTGDKVEAIMRRTNPGADIAVVSNPEFLREGAAIEDFKRPDRILLGVEDERAQAVMTEIYRPLSLNAPPLLFVDRRTAELTKYAGNAFLAMKIAFINEMADLCEKTGANVQDLARGIGLDGRIGSKFLNAGPGYGGSCFPKDTLALVRIGEDFGSPVPLVETVVASNARRKAGMAGRVIAAMGGDVSGKRIGVLGLTFKPNTDDLRESPALTLIEDLQAAGAWVRAYDPEGMEAARGMLEGVVFAHDEYDAAEGVDGMVLVTEWNAFRSLDLARLRGLMAKPVFVDLRNVYRDKEMEAAGFAYFSIGRPKGSGKGTERRAAAE